MAEEKKVIHVKDLVIKADNVHFEPTTTQQEPVQPMPGAVPRRPFDGFFGRRGMEQAPPTAQEVTPEQTETEASAPESEPVPEQEAEVTEESSQDTPPVDVNQPLQRRPFSWI